MKILKEAIIKLIPFVLLVSLFLAAPIDKGWQENIGGIRGLKIMKELPYNENLPKKPEYKIGLASNHRVVFLNKNKAMRSIRKEVPKAFAAMKEQHGVQKISKWNWQLYEIYFWDSDMDDEEGIILGEFIAIYMNSFKRN